MHMLSSCQLYAGKVQHVDSMAKETLRRLTLLVLQRAYQQPSSQVASMYSVQCVLLREA
jgi:hypothetical protein